MWHIYDKFDNVLMWDANVITFSSKEKAEQFIADSDFTSFMEDFAKNISIKEEAIDYDDIIAEGEMNCDGLKVIYDKEKCELFLVETGND